MNLKKTIQLTGLILLVQSTAISQVLQKTIADDFNQDFNHSSIVPYDVTGNTGSSIVASTRYSNHPLNTESKSVLSLIDGVGNLDASILIDHSPNGLEGCLDVAMGVDDNIVITGFVEDADGVRRIFVTEAEFSGVGTGTIIKSHLIDLEDGFSSMGTTIIYDDRRNTYYLGGISIKNPAQIDSDSRGFVMRLDEDFNILWTQEFTGVTAGGLTGVNDLLITPRGLFVTGTYFDNSSAQSSGMTAVMLRIANGFPKWDLSHKSFTIGGGSQPGIQAVYEATNDGTIYLLSNNPEFHAFQITEIQDADNISANVTNEYVIAPNVPFTQNSTGLGLTFNQTNINELIIMGLIPHTDYDVTFNNSSAFLVPFNRTTGTVSGGSRQYKVASQNYASFTPELLNPFLSGAMYNSYSPTSIIPNDYDGYTFLAHRLMSNGNYNTEYYNTTSSLFINDCDQDMAVEMYDIDEVSYRKLNFQKYFPYLSTINPLVTSPKLTMKDLCPIGGEKSVKQDETGEQTNLSSVELLLFPNPSGTGTFTLQLDGFQGVKNIAVCNVNGETVIEATTSTNRLEIDASCLDNGIYFVKVMDSMNQTTEKIVLQ